MSGGIIGDKVGLGKTLSVVLPMICMDQGHRDRITLVVVTTNAKSQWYHEMIQYGVDEKSIAHIGDPGQLIKAIKDKKTVWIITHTRILTWKEVETIKEKRGRKAAVTAEVGFDRAVQIQMRRYWPQKMRDTEPHYIRQKKTQDKKKKRDYEDNKEKTGYEYDN